MNDQPETKAGADERLSLVDLLQPMETFKETDEDGNKRLVTENYVHEGCVLILCGTNGKPIGWLDTHAAVSGRVYRHHIIKPKSADEIAPAPPSAEPVEDDLKDATPGPWVADHGNGDYFGIFQKETGEPIAYLVEEYHAGGNYVLLPVDLAHVKYLRGEGDPHREISYGRAKEHRANAFLIATAVNAYRAAHPPVTRERERIEALATHEELIELAVWVEAVPDALLSDTSPNAKYFIRVGEILRALAQPAASEDGR